MEKQSKLILPMRIYMSMVYEPPKVDHRGVKGPKLRLMYTNFRFVMAFEYRGLNAEYPLSAELDESKGLLDHTTTSFYPMRLTYE
jgi:hypothetical protein